MRNVVQLGIFMTLAACSPRAADQQQSASSSTEAAATANPLRPPETETTSLATRADFEKRDLDWPLTVDAGELGCTDQARWVKVRGRLYGLNGTAGAGRGFAAIEPIWREDEKMAESLKALGAPNDPPLRVNIGDMIAEAGKFC